MNEEKLNTWEEFYKDDKAKTLSLFEDACQRQLYEQLRQSQAGQYQQYQRQALAPLTTYLGSCGSGILGGLK